MSSKADGGKKPGANTKFLRELEAINRAFNVEKTVSRLSSSTASSRSKSTENSLLPQRRTVKKEESKQGTRVSIEKDKRSSIWSWRGLKALTHIRNLRFNCCFSLVVHTIYCLPPFFNGESLLVHWKRRDGNRMTHSVRVCDGVAKFEEQLTFSCSVYGSRSGPHHSAKYEAKHFLLYASVDDAPELDLGKHQIDLTRLLPLTLEDLEEEKSSGKWTTSFRLSGKARGAILNVSFGYLVIDNNSSTCNNEPDYHKNVPKIQNSLQNRETTVKSIESFDLRTELSSQGASALPKLSISDQSTEDLHEPETKPNSRTKICDFTNLVHQKQDEETAVNRAVKELEINDVPSHIGFPEMNLCKTQDAEEYSASICGKADVSAVDERELFLKGYVKPEFSPSKTSQVRDSLEIGPSCDVDIDEVASIKSSSVEVADQTMNQSISNQDDNGKQWDMTPNDQIMEDLEEALRYNLDLLEEGLDFHDETDLAYADKRPEVEFDYEDYTNGKFLGLEDFSDSVANDFLEMLGLDHSPSGNSESEPDSPRERLLREFEKDALSSGGLFNFIDDNPSEVLGDIPSGSYWGTMSDDFAHSSTFDGSNELPHVEADPYDMKTSASEMAHMETESLMREWGINEEVFKHSPSTSCSGFDNSTQGTFEDPPQLPPLGDDLGPFVLTHNGGFLRSMNPSLFRKSKIGGSLIMQASNPVVVPAEMGSNISSILQGLASVGIEKLSMQAKKLMPLEEITGITIQQLAWEGTQNMQGPEGQDVQSRGSDICRNTNHKSLKGKSKEFGSKPLRKSMEYASLEDLAPLAMDEIEALSIEGLRMQCGMSDDEAVSPSMSSHPGSDLPSFQKHDVGLHGTCGVQLMDVKDNGEDVDGLMGLSLTLDEWMKLDSGEINNEDLVNEHTSKVLAAHHATSLDQFHGKSKGEKRSSRSRKCGLLGNNFTIALMVQLRDPLRDYEAVGSPMLALIQVERQFVPPKPKIYSTVSVLSDSKNETETHENAKEEEVAETPPEQDGVSEFKITEVQVAGLKVDEGKKLWGSKNQQQSSSRWLLANGMGKKASKHPLLKSKVDSISTTMAAKLANPLWSVSSRAHKRERLDGRKW